MDVRTALELLGVTESATNDEVRRAYLRKIKVHKPEREPEMFAKLREAHELLSSGIIWIAPAEIEGLPEFAEESHPSPVASSTPSALEALHRALEKVESGALHEVEVVEDSLDEVGADELSAIDVYRVLHVIIRMFAANRFEHARDLTVRLRPLVGGMGGELALFRGQSAIEWAIVGELVSLDGLPEPVRCAIASVLREHALDQLGARFEASLMLVDSNDRRYAAALIRHQTSVLKDLLLARQVVPVPARDNWANSAGAIAIAITFFLGLSVMQMFRDPSARRPPRSLPPADVHNVLIDRGVRPDVAAPPICARDEPACVSLSILGNRQLACPQLRHASVVLGPYGSEPLRSRVFRRDQRAAGELELVLDGVQEMIAESCAR